jgi:hypothetical protein
MKKKMLFVLFAASSIFFSCTAPSQIVNSWKDPGTSIQNPAIHKIVVAAIIYDPTVRRQIEDYMVSLYPGMATQSYVVFGGDPLKGDEEKYNQSLKDQGYDGIIIIRQTNENVNQHYVPGQMPTYYHTWGGYWHNGWGATFVNPGRPGHMATNRTWIVQVTVFSVLENKMIWSANTSTTNPGGRVPLFEDVCHAARAKMKTDGFLK